MVNQEYLNTYEAFFFEIDEVIYPEKDYLLQVYYLFAQFIEYGEQIEGEGIIRFMQETYFAEGPENIFSKTASQFGIDQKYQLNFDLLLQNARLPLKLLLFAPVLDFLQALKLAGKPIFLLAEGDPAAQLNKIRQIEWNGLEQYLKVYFVAESPNASLVETLHTVIVEHTLNAEQILVVGQPFRLENLTNTGQIKFITTDKLSLS
jgi:FMN phosphatase YigB (HAD superfamily)